MIRSLNFFENCLIFFAHPMSEQVQKLLLQLVKTKLEKKSSKKSEDNFMTQEMVDHKKSEEQEDKSKQETEGQKQKMKRDNEEVGAQVSQEETWAMYRRLIVENAVRFFMILLYCAVAFIAIAKAGIIILTTFQHLLHGIFAAGVPTISPKS